MKAFLITKNGKRLCLAGVGSSGVLTAIATWVKSPRKPNSERTGLTVGGLTERHDHIRWAKDVPLAVGDEITIRLVKTAKVDRPSSGKNATAVPKSRPSVITTRNCGWSSRSRTAMGRSGGRR